MRYLFVFILIFSFHFLIAQEKVHFFADDGLKITADLYQVDKERPYVLLFHQAGYSRGEYREITNKIIKFGYNCLAVDLRSGGEVNYIQNHTALVAVQQGFSTDYLSSQKDIEAAIKWAKQQNGKPVVLLGSSFSASLCLLTAKTNDNVKAVIAFSPGEFFGEEKNVRNEIRNLNIPVFASSSSREIQYVDTLLSFVPSTNKTIFAPKTGGEHGSKSLWKKNPNSQEYWLALTMFFSKIR